MIGLCIYLFGCILSFICILLVIRQYSDEIKLSDLFFILIATMFSYIGIFVIAIVWFINSDIGELTIWRWK